MFLAMEIIKLVKLPGSTVNPVLLELQSRVDSVGQAALTSPPPPSHQVVADGSNMLQFWEAWEVSDSLFIPGTLPPHLLPLGMFPRSAPRTQFPGGKLRGWKEILGYNQMCKKLFLYT